MLIDQDQQADALRAVGRFLDAEFAQSIELVNTQAALSMAWRRGRGRGSRRFREQDLAELREQAKAARGTPTGSVRGGYAERLRVIGQEIEAEHTEFMHILEQPGG